MLGCGLCIDRNCPHALFSELVWGVRGRWQLLHSLQGLQWGAECLCWPFLVWGIVSRDLSEELSPLYIKYFPTVCEKDRFLYSFPIIENLACWRVFLG